ncbi:MAG TPA: hypothetical protein VHD55_02605 [Candidatus Paceibacterota bacterium]|nr:hypothetical protein [Candidatus Paceibacterota bacterium]
MSKIETQVMASVGVIYAARALMSATAIKLYALVASFAGIVFFASVPHVAANFFSVAHSGPTSVVFFVVYAVLSTTVVVQFALAVGAAAAVSLFVSGVHSFLSGKAVTA